MNGAGGPPKVGANHTAMTPLQLLARTAAVHPDHCAVIHGPRRYTWAQHFERCRRLCSALCKRGIGHGDVVSSMLGNTPECLEAHQGVPMTGATLNPMNTRLDARTTAFILGHAEAKILIVDTEFSKVVGEALQMMEAGKRPFVIDVDDQLCAERGPRLGSMDYEAFIAAGDPNEPWEFQGDEWDAISLNYTSGTTADPKGCLLHHRGLYLNSLNNIVTWSMPRHSVYLWTLPMFHCNGWCFPYTVTALAGTHVCLRKVVAADIFAAIADHKVTHLCGAPIVMSTMLQFEGKRTWAHDVRMMTAASAPPAPMLAKMGNLGIEVSHVYGLTEVYGPAVVCEWKEKWNSLPVEDQAVIKARQGVRYLACEGLDVLDEESMNPVPRDGATIGEVCFRGNLVMKGYLKNPKATSEAFNKGWFHTGDLAVVHPDGYLQLKDRSKDIIISGGENISSLEVESILFGHPKILEAAVVARADEKWGETPCAFITVGEGHTLTEEELYRWCQQQMPRFMVPRTYIFMELPKTSTGKVQKHVLRAQVKELKKPSFSIKSSDDQRKSKL